MDEEYINRLIYEYNPQWKGELEVEEFKRPLYFEVKKYMPKKQIIGITGLRRVGKTTLMKQILSELKPEECIFFSFDEEETHRKEVLVYVINYFLNNFNGKYIFLDEIHYIPDWQGILKRFYDTMSIKFVISGSASLEIKKGKESLAGRIMTSHMPCLTFREYLELKGKKVQSVNLNFKDLSLLYNSLLPEKEYFEHEFRQYLYKGAFPEIVEEEDEEFIRRYIRDIVVKKIIYSDIPDLFEIKRRDLLFDLFKHICSESSNLFEIKNLCNIFNADYTTISNYLHYLKLSFLINIAQTYSKSSSARLRKNKKVYVIHPSLAFAILNYPKDILGVGKIMGQYVETLFGDKFFWRSKTKNEVDAVSVTMDQKILPIEVKYRERGGKITGLYEFMNKFSASKGIVVTKNTFKKEEVEQGMILYIPAWLFLLADDKPMDYREML
ncbi:MAG: hypothetical protein A7315_07345 [Candidatus Altiarchaeales archaeon WOR_SM1_79]|nr:MAG: hypothetical protein A7315_07345 [Candidatus Altiarchaeales archaeon WOR_SM1_79]